MARKSKKQRKREEALQQPAAAPTGSPAATAAAVVESSPTFAEIASGQKHKHKLKPSRRPLNAQVSEDSLLDDLPPLIIGFVCAIMPTLVTPKVRDLYQLPKLLFVTEGTSWVLLCLAALALFRRPLRLPKVPALWPLIGFALTVLISVVVAPSETGGMLSLFAKMDAYRWGACMLTGLFTLMVVTRPRHILYVVGGMLIGGSQVALFGVAQEHNISSLLPAEASDWVGINRPGSTFGNRNMAAQLIVSVMPAAYVLLAMSLRWVSRRRFDLAVIAGILGSLFLWLLLYYLRLSVTRSAWGGALLGGVVAAGLWGAAAARGRKRRPSEAKGSAPKNHPWLGVVLAGLLLTLGGAAVFGMSSFLTQKGFKASYDTGKGDEKRQMGIFELVRTAKNFDQPHWAMRRMMWSSTWEAIKARPLGAGAGNWRVLFPQYIVQRQANDHFSISKQPTRAHNDFLQIWSEFGTQGFVCFMALLGALCWMVWRTVTLQRQASLVERDDIAWMTLASLSSLAGVIAICGDALLSFPFQLPAPTFLFFIHFGVIGAAYAQVRAVASPTQGGTTESGISKTHFALPAQAWVRALMLIVALGATVYTFKVNERLREAERSFSSARKNNRLGNQQVALKAIQRAIAINPNDFQNHFIEALCYNKMGRMSGEQGAISSIKKSLDLYPNLLNAWVNLAMFSRKAGQVEEMNKALDKALELKPDEAYALNIRAQQWLRHGRHKDTATLLLPFIDVHCENRSFLYNAEKAFTAQKDWANLAKVQTCQVKAIKARRLKPTMRDYASMRSQDAKRVHDGKLAGWAKVGDTWARAARWKEAASAYGEAAALAKHTRPDVKRKFTMALARLGRWDQAVHEAGVTVSVAKSEANALLKDLEGLRKRTKDKTSQAQIDRLMRGVEKAGGSAVNSRLARQDADDDKKIATFIKRYRARRKDGKPGEALDWLRKAAERGKERRADVKRAFAVGLAEVGQWDQALHEAKVAVRIDWRQRERLVIGLRALRKTVSQQMKKPLEDLIAKARLL